MSSTAAPAPQLPLSEAGRLLNVFAAPSRTFTDIRTNASWWVPWLLSALIGFAFMQVVQQKIGFEQIVRQQITSSPSRSAQFEKLSPEQQQRQMDISVKFWKGFNYFTPVFSLLALVIISGILMAALNFGLGAEVKFKQSMAVVAYAGLVNIVGSILGIVSLLIGVRDPEAFDIQNPVATNPAYFMDPSQHKFLHGMASSLDVFIIWMIILLGIGYSSLSKVKKGTAIVVVAALYLVWKLVISGVSAL